MPALVKADKRLHLKQLGPLVGLGLACLLLMAFTWPWDRHGPWPCKSEIPVRQCALPTLEERLAEGGLDPHEGFCFACFGDQRALADGEWQELIGHISTLRCEGEPILFALDTGDIVDSGAHCDQFDHLAGILAPLDSIPYLVAVGNHEVDNNRDPLAREFLAAFLASMDSVITPERFYYKKEIGPLRLICLDTSDMVYGDKGFADWSDSLQPGLRAAEQFAWLAAELADTTWKGSTIVAAHHPLIQSSRKHRKQAQALWSYRYQGRTLPDMFLDGGVNLVISGHTHTYERFRLRREDGRELHIVNLSGRPRTSFLWKGDGRRRAKEIAGTEIEWLADKGWRDLEGWRIFQEEAMVEDEADQFGLFTVDPGGDIWLEMFFLDEDRPDGLRQEMPQRLVTLRAATP
jgi:hypothetical protein